jgi:thiamine biosynthesis protein ThiI
MYNYVIIHYGEIGLKGLNRPLFEKRLVENIMKAVKGVEFRRIKRIRGRIILELNERTNLTDLERSLLRVFGIAWFAFCFVTDPTLEDIKSLVAERFDFKEGIKVKVSTKRADKSLPFTSIDVNRELGAYLKEKFKVDILLRNPEREIFVELANGKAYVFDRKIKGLYGLPVGVSGKVLHLLSGGIDSPVAAWLLMKRGCEVDFIHFHAFKKFDKEKNAKILELAKILSQYCFRTKVFFVPFHPFVKEAVKAPPAYRLILFRRFMMRVAEEVAKQHGIKALGTGESLAQVSSQTLDNIVTISQATSLPIFRPLLTYDKNEIVELARKIGTFQISIMPYRDCCTLLLTKHPATKSDPKLIGKFEEKMDLKSAIDESLRITEVVDIE